MLTFSQFLEGNINYFDPDQHNIDQDLLDMIANNASRLFYHLLDRGLLEQFFKRTIAYFFYNLSEDYPDNIKQLMESASISIRNWLDNDEKVPQAIIDEIDALHIWRPSILLLALAINEVQNIESFEPIRNSQGKVMQKQPLSQNYIDFRVLLSSLNNYYNILKEIAELILHNYKEPVEEQDTLREFVNRDPRYVTEEELGAIFVFLIDKNEIGNLIEYRKTNESHSTDLRKNYNTYFLKSYYLGAGKLTINEVISMFLEERRFIAILQVFIRNLI